VLRTRFFAAALFGVALAAVAGAQDRKFDLQFKNAKGEFVPFYQEMTTDVTQVIAVQGQSLTQRQKSVFFYQWTPIKEEKVKEGTEEVTKYTVKQKIEGLQMDIDISGNPIKYDSTKADAGGGANNPGLVEFFRNLKDSEFVATIGKGYKVEKVEGKDAFVNKLGAGSAQMEGLLKKVMTEDALKEMTDPTYRLVPEGPKKKGDKWEKKSTLKLGPIGDYDLTYKFTYAEPDKEGERKDWDKIDVETIINYTAPKEGAEGLLFRIKEGSKLTSDPAESKGVVYYDPKAQRIPFAQINIKLKGDLTVVIGGTDTKVELTQEQKTTIRTRDTSFIETKSATPPAPPAPPAPEKK
jgi:hypothetical protein